MSWTPLPLRAPRDPWQPRKAGPEEGRAAPPGAGPAWLAADQRARAVLLRVQILSAPAQRGGSASYCTAGVPTFPPLGGGAGGVTSAQFGKRDVEKILSIRFPQSPFLGVSLLLSLTLSPLNSGGGGRDPANLSPGARGKGIGGPMCSPIPAPDVIRSDLGQASSGKAEWEDGSA